MCWLFKPSILIFFWKKVQFLCYIISWYNLIYQIEWMLLSEYILIRWNIKRSFIAHLSSMLRGQDAWQPIVQWTAPPWPSGRSAGARQEQTGRWGWRTPPACTHIQNTVTLNRTRLPIPLNLIKLGPITSLSRTLRLNWHNLLPLTIGLFFVHYFSLAFL